MRILDERGPTPDSVVEEHVALPDTRPTDRAFIRLNMIASADGGTTVAGVSGGLGNRDDHAVFGALRANADGVLVGLGTVVAEHYRVPGDAGPPDLRRRRRARRQRQSRAVRVGPGHARAPGRRRTGTRRCPRAARRHRRAGGRRRGRDRAPRRGADRRRWAHPRRGAGRERTGRRVLRHHRAARDRRWLGARRATVPTRRRRCGTSSTGSSTTKGSSSSGTGTADMVTEWPTGTDVVTIALHDRVAVITFNRPERRNAIHHEMHGPIDARLGGVRHE